MPTPTLKDLVARIRALEAAAVQLLARQNAPAKSKTKATTKAKAKAPAKKASPKAKAKAPVKAVAATKQGQGPGQGEGQGQGSDQGHGSGQGNSGQDQGSDHGPTRRRQVEASWGSPPRSWRYRPSEYAYPGRHRQLGGGPAMREPPPAASLARGQPGRSAAPYSALFRRPSPA